MAEDNLATFDQLFGWLTSRARMLITPVRLTETFRVHDVFIAAITRPSRATPKHIVVMSTVVSIAKALGTY